MAKIDGWHVHDRTFGDTAVSGLISGFMAGAVMAVFLIIALGLSGESPADVLNRFGPAEGATSPLFGAVNHLAMSGIYGMLFALIWRWVRLRSVGRGLVLIAGLIYATLLFIIAQTVLLPVNGSPLLEIPAHFAVAHLIYGAILGGLFLRRGSA